MKKLLELLKTEEAQVKLRRYIFEDFILRFKDMTMLIIAENDDEFVEDFTKFTRVMWNTKDAIAVNTFSPERFEIELKTIKFNKFMKRYIAGDFEQLINILTKKVS